jgi:GTP-binding protein HflX
MQPDERAFLVGVEWKGSRPLLPVEESLDELARLADTAGLEVVGRAWQRFDRPDANTYIRSGKVEEVKILVEDMDANVVLFDDELLPRHQRELEKAFGDDVKVVDRTALILDIFAQHAHTNEGQLQVELAQLEYRLPRLTRMWTHLARQAGGRAGGMGGARRAAGQAAWAAAWACAAPGKPRLKLTAVKSAGVFRSLKRNWTRCGSGASNNAASGSKPHYPSLRW